MLKRQLLLLLSLFTTTTCFAGQNITGQLYVSGRTGIGTTAPSATLEVVGSIYGTTRFKVQGAGAANTRVVSIRNAANGETFVINNNGNTGIGATPFSNGTKLTVSGTIRQTDPGDSAAVDNGLTGNTGGLRFAATSALADPPDGAAFQIWGIGSTSFPGQMYFDSGASDSAFITFRTAPSATVLSNRMRILANGNVGIGNTLPRTKLEISNTVSMIDPNNGGQGRFGIGTTAPSARIHIIGTGSSNAALSLLVGVSTTASTIVVSNAGNVGIGTSRPTALFSVGTASQFQIASSGNVTTTAGITGAAITATSYRGGVAVGSALNLQSTSGVGTTDRINFTTGNAGGTKSMTILSGGSVGINTTAPTARVHIAQTGSSNSAIAILVGAATSSAKFMVTNAGNVGIGATAPYGLLTVAGHIHTKATAPTVASNDCGTTSQGAVTALSTDVSGSVTVGTVAPTSCAITFATAWTNAPNCIAGEDSTALAVKAIATTTKLTISAGVSIQSDVLTWVCFGNE